MKKLGIFLSLLLVVSVLLSGCYSAIPEQTMPTEPEQTTTSEMTQTSVPSESTEETEIEKELKTFVTYPAPHVYSQSAAPLRLLPIENDGFICIKRTSTVVKFLQSDGTQMILCGIGGCTHKDSTCPAYFKNISRLSICNGKWVVATDEWAKLGGSVELFYVDPASGERQKLCEWTADNEKFISVNKLLCSSNAAYLVLSYMNAMDDGTMQSLIRVSLPDGVQRVLFTAQDSNSINFLGIVDRGLVVEKREVTEVPMDMTDYFAEHPGADENAYGDYYRRTLEENTKNRLQLLATEDGSVIETIADSANGYLSAGEDMCWEQNIVYQVGNELICYDTENQTHRVVAEGNSTNYMIFDGRVWQFIPDGDECRFILTDIFTGESFELNQKSLYVTPRVETDDAFLGLTPDYNGTVLISKQDFYNEVYDNMVKFPTGS